MLALAKRNSEVLDQISKASQPGFFSRLNPDIGYT